MFLVYTCSLLAPPVHSSPVIVPLLSQLPANPIEDPADWAWGQHPLNGLGYKARDGLTVEVCLANPAMVNTAKCDLPLDVCLANPQYLSSIGCSGNDLPDLPLDVSLTYPELLTRSACSGLDLPLEACLANPAVLTKPSCAGNKYPLDVCLDNPPLLSQPSCSDNLSGSVCAQNPAITLIPTCSGALAGYQPSLFECVDNKEALCSLNLCEKHQFVVKC